MLQACEEFRCDKVQLPIKVKVSAVTVGSVPVPLGCRTLVFLLGCGFLSVTPVSAAQSPVPDGFISVPAAEQAGVLGEVSAAAQDLRERRFVGCAEIARDRLTADGEVAERLPLMKLYSTGTDSLCYEFRVDSVNISGRNSDYIFSLNSLGASVEGPFELAYVGIDPDYYGSVEHFFSIPYQVDWVPIDQLTASDGFKVVSMHRKPDASLLRIGFQSAVSPDGFPDRILQGGWFECDESMSYAVTGFEVQYLFRGRVWRSHLYRTYTRRGPAVAVAMAGGEHGIADSDPHVFFRHSFSYTNEGVPSEKYMVSGYGFTEPGFGGRSGQSFWFWVVNGGFVVTVLAVWLIRMARCKRKPAEPKKSANPGG